MIIRDATPADRPVIERMVRALVEHEGAVVADFSLDDDGLIILAERRHEIAGMIIAYPLSRPMLIGNLWVEPKHRRRGVGTRLMTEVMRYAARLGTEIIFDVHPENPTAARFYRAIGFEPFPARHEGAAETADVAAQVAAAGGSSSLSRRIGRAGAANTRCPAAFPGFGGRVVGVGAEDERLV